MAAGDATSADVPGRYDLVIDGKGYVFADSEQPRAVYGLTPPFVDRQNVSNQYGDNAQDFFLTVRQRDWSLGEQQKFFRSGSDGRYWQGSNVDVGTPGQVKLAQTITSVSFAATISACARDTNGQKIIAASSTKLYTIDPAGSITDNGVHGLGATPTKFGLVSDGHNNYVTTLNSGTVGVRKWTGAAYSTFSATAADSIAFLNNTLYGYRGASGDLGRWDTSGTWTTLFTWKDAVGTVFGGGSNAAAILEPYGGRLLILFPYGMLGAAELWVYDGTGVSLLHVFPPNYLASDIEVLYGVAYIGGSFFKATGTTSQYTRPAVHFYDGSQIGLIWQANGYSSSASSDTFGGPHPAVVASNGRIVFTDDTTNMVLAYNPATGGVSTIGSYSAGGTDARMAATGWTFLHTRNGSTGYYSGNSSYPSSGYVISSLVDFDSSLSKIFRGVKVEFDDASDGDGGTVDIAYQVDSVSGSWTSLATDVASGTETSFSTSTTGHAIAIKVTLNKGTSTAGPVLKSLSVRGAPQLPQYARAVYVLDCSGTFEAPRELRDGTSHPLTGYEQAVNLRTSARSATPISITDKINGTFTGLIDINDEQGLNILESHPFPADKAHPGSYLVRVTVRGV